MEKISFFDILVQSWNLSFSRAKLLFFGFFMALPIATQFLFPRFLDQPDATTLITYVLASPGYSLLFLCFYFFSTLFGKGNLIYEFSLKQKKREPSSQKTSAKTTLWKQTKRVLVIELLFGAFLLFLTFIFTFPSVASFFLFEKIPETLIFIGLILSLPLFIVTLFIHQFSLYYFLLSPLQITSAIERGIVLFRQHRSITLFFGLFAFGISGAFTFSLNLAMLGGVVLLQKILVGIPESILLFCLSLGFLTWYAVFSQALWFRFFLYLAQPKKPLPSEDSILAKENIPETPTV